MAKNQDEKNLVIPQSELICRPDRRCCSYGSSCPAEYKVTPKGDMVFNRCGC